MTASGLLTALIEVGVCATVLIFRMRRPIGVAWSAPGAAFLATSAPPEGGFAVASRTCEPGTDEAVAVGV